MSLNDLFLREEVKESDPESIRNIVMSTGFFNEEEISLAVELMEERLARGIASGYYYVFAEKDNRAVCFTCYGKIPCTKSSYDLYWIATHQDLRGTGIGKKLLYMTEDKIKELGGRSVYIETSSRKQYDPTRMFYLRCGYDEIARLTDFYDTNDDKVIYLKRL